MIGKIQDVLSGAVVIGAVEKAAASMQGAGKAKQGDDTKSDATSAKDIEKLQDEWNKNPSFGQEIEEKDIEIPPMDEETVSNVTDELNELMDKINCNLEFKYNKDVDVMTVKMIDKTSKEVIKEFPPEEMVKNMVKAKEWIGAFLDRNA